MATILFYNEKVMILRKEFFIFDISIFCETFFLSKSILLNLRLCLTEKKERKALPCINDFQLFLFRKASMAGLNWESLMDLAKVKFRFLTVFLEYFSLFSKSTQLNLR